MLLHKLPACCCPSLSWPLFSCVQEGDYITIIIMGHASFGTLGSAIKKHVFSSQSASPSDRRRRFRALLRTAREIAMALEVLADSLPSSLPLFLCPCLGFIADLELTPDFVSATSY